MKIICPWRSQMDMSILERCVIYYSFTPCPWWFFLSQALEEMAAKNDGIVTCPRTGKSCPFTLLRKVFISWSLFLHPEPLPPWVGMVCIVCKNSFMNSNFGLDWQHEYKWSSTPAISSEIMSLYHCLPITFAFYKVQSSMGRYSYIDNHGINALTLVSIIVKIMLV